MFEPIATNSARDEYEESIQSPAINDILDEHWFQKLLKL